MRIIQKFPLYTLSEGMRAPAGSMPILIASERIVMPADSKFLYAGVENGTLTVWASCDTDQPNKDELFYRVNIGAAHPLEAKHLASFQASTWTWHIFSTIERFS